MATREIWLPARYGYLRDMASDAICHQGDMATHEILLQTRLGYLRDMLAYKMLAISGFLFPVISPIQLYCLLARYDYLRDMATREILLLTRYGYLRGMTTCEV